MSQFDNLGSFQEPRYNRKNKFDNNKNYKPKSQQDDVSDNTRKVKIGENNGYFITVKKDHKFQNVKSGLSVCKTCGQNFMFESAYELHLKSCSQNHTSYII